MNIKEVFEQAQKENKQVWNVTVMKSSGKYYCTEEPIIASPYTFIQKLFQKQLKNIKKIG